jgi:hypothetical protein
MSIVAAFMHVRYATLLRFTTAKFAKFAKDPNEAPSGPFAHFATFAVENSTAVRPLHP